MKWIKSAVKVMETCTYMNELSQEKLSAKQAYDEEKSFAGPPSYLSQPVTAHLERHS